MNFFTNEKTQDSSLQELVDKINFYRDELLKQGPSLTQIYFSTKSEQNLASLNLLLKNLANTNFVLDLINSLQGSNINADSKKQKIKSFIPGQLKPNKEAIKSIILHFENHEAKNLNELINSFIEKIESNSEDSISKLQTYYDRSKYAEQALRIIGIVLMVSAGVALFSSGFDTAFALLIIGAIVHQSRKFFSGYKDLSEELKEKTDTKNIDLKTSTYIDRWMITEDTKEKAEQLKQYLQLNS